MEIWQMRYFIQVCKDKNFTKAAKNLYISQQGLSKAIKNIEEEFEVSLLERSSKGVRPTYFGSVLLEQSQKIINDYDLMVELLSKNVTQKKGTISIGMASILHSDFFEIICNFQETYPDIKFNILELGSYACEKHLADNLIDICFAIKPANTTLYEFIPVSVYQMILLVNKKNPLTNKRAVVTKDLSNEKFIMVSPDYKIRSKIVDRCMKAGFFPNIAFTTSQLDFIIELVSLNKGIAIVPQLNSLKAEKIHNNISVHSFKDKPFKIEVGFIINKTQNPNHVTGTFLKYIKKCPRS